MTDTPPLDQPPEDLAAKRAVRARLFAFLDDIGIATRTYDHEPVYTVEQGAHMKAQWPGGHTKNLFLKDKKGALLMISAKDDTDVPLKELHKVMDVARLSFGKADLMQEVLGVTPGSVTAFALMNDPEHRVRFILDAALLEHDPIHFHPLENSGTTAIAPGDFLRFLEALNRPREVFCFKTMAPVTL